MVDQNNSAPAERGVTLSTLKEILDHHEGVQNERLTKAEAAVEALQTRNALAEVNHRNTRLDKRGREKVIQMGSFQNLMLKSHAGALYDIERA